MLYYILLGIGFIGTLIIIGYLFSKLTPNNVPENLAGFFSSILKMAIALAIALYAGLFLAGLVL